MAIKTISVELDAYSLLVQARRHPKESFSSVVRRARWDGPQYTGRALLIHLRERIRRGLALSEDSIRGLISITKLGFTPRTPQGALGSAAHAYLVDASFLLGLEMEVAAIKEGPVTRFLASREESVFRVSIITCGEFVAGLASNDVALGNQALSRFETMTLSPAIAELYAKEIDALRAGTGTHHRGDNATWVGCTAVALDSPLITQQANQYAGIAGLQIVTL